MQRDHSLIDLPLVVDEVDPIGILRGLLIHLFGRSQVIRRLNPRHHLIRLFYYVKVFKHSSQRRQCMSLPIRRGYISTTMASGFRPQPICNRNEVNRVHLNHRQRRGPNHQFNLRSILVEGILQLGPEMVVVVVEEQAGAAQSMDLPDAEAPVDAVEVSE